MVAGARYERVHGLLLYQHLGISRRPSSPAESLFHDLQRDDDGGPRLRERARRRDEDRASSRWTYYRDFGRSRLRPRLTRRADRRREPTADDGKGRVGLDRRTRARLLRSLGRRDEPPCLLPPGIHHLEAWNEAICEGAPGVHSSNGPVSGSDALWISSTGPHTSFRFADSSICFCSVSRGLGGDPPASITILSGDVHTTSIVDVDLGGACGSSHVRQVVCSPFRNPLESRDRRVVKMTGPRGAAKLFARLARLAGVEPVDVSWKLATPRSFENSIGQLELEVEPRP